MAKEEMEAITEDRWDADIWGIEKAEGRKPKLIFYFGENVSMELFSRRCCAKFDRTIGWQIIQGMSLLLSEHSYPERRNLRNQ